MDGLHEAGGSGLHKPVQGKVEIQYRRFDQSLQKYRDDHWGTICDDQFGDEDALVLCSMMGYSVGYGLFFTIINTISIFHNY
ncbi:hypothetical protein DPMN_034082 [Dreissena polymorpha]|uniref:SRCR domain-containing protein n=1 Tax=Dreissena polymorpha TaxID=45954 RepID=A0A9D4M779_DREPO|nr:hypothetical protein DPMN_034082 [Dreissena polymorpha]